MKLGKHLHMTMILVFEAIWLPKPTFFFTKLAYCADGCYCNNMGRKILRRVISRNEKLV